LTLIEIWQKDIIYSVFLSQFKTHALNMKKRFPLSQAKKLDSTDLLAVARKKYHLDSGINFCFNSLGAPHRRTDAYIKRFMNHWKKHQVEGHFSPMLGISASHGFCFFREEFRDWCTQILGASGPSETAIVSEQSATFSALFSWLVREQLIVNDRYVVLYEATGAFPSDEKIIQEVVRLCPTSGDHEVVLYPIPQKDGLIDEDALLELVKKIGKNLSTVVFGNGGIHWQTGQVLDLSRIGPAVKKVGGKTLVNLAHALGTVELKLHEWQISAAVACTYKFMSGGPGGPSLVFIHKDEDTSDLLPVGWFSFTNPIETLQGEPAQMKKGAQKIEASNPQVLGWLPVFAALEEWCFWGGDIIFKKASDLKYYFFECFNSLNSELDVFELLTPDSCSVEIMFSLKEPHNVKVLHKYLKEKGIICDLRNNDRIRIGMFPLTTSFKDAIKDNCGMF